jgi:hypothetical protein
LKNTIDNLLLQFPWLQVHISATEYLGPEYYQRLLKPYVFGGKTDLDILREWLESEHASLGSGHALEIGPGPGRATSVFLNTIRDRNLHLVDLSQQMIIFCKNLFKQEQRLTYIRSDAIDFLRNNTTQFSLGFSLWSFSHSIHRAIQMFGRVAGEALADEALRALFQSALQPGARFMLIHFDPHSPEQRISLRQRSKLQPYLTAAADVPSRMVLNKVTDDLVRRGLVSVDVRHLVGEPIRYESMNEALEIFMNLHMEGMFNDHPLLPEVMAELTSDLSEYRDESGAITVGVGCYVYTYEING